MQDPVDPSPLLTPDPEQPDIHRQQTPPPTDTTESEINSAACAVAPEDAPRPFVRLRKRLWDAALPLVFLAIAIVCVIGTVVLSLPHTAVPKLDFIDENGVIIYGEVSQFSWNDPKQLSVLWSISWDKYDADGNPIHNDTAVDVYLDSTSKPAFSFDPTQLPAFEDGERPNDWGSFSMQHQTFDLYDTVLDEYYASTFAFVVESATNKTVPIDSFDIKSSRQSDFTITSGLAWTKNNVTFRGENGPYAVGVTSIEIYIYIQRSRPVRAITFSMFAVNWILTLCSVVITFVVSKRRREVRDGVVILPITVIISIPTIRSIFPASPPLGAFLDIVGLFPQMLILLLCVMWVLCTSLMRPTRDGGSAPEQKEVETSADA